MTPDSELASQASGVEPAQPGEVRIRRALLSVSDKRGLVELARGLRELDVEIVSTGGSARALAEAGVEVRAIEDYTGFPEIMDGRVKTLNPRLYAGLLARRDDESHLAAGGGSGDRAGRSGVREPLSVRGDDRQSGGDRGAGDREHRHRRPDDDPRGGQEQRFRGRAHRSRRLRPGARRAARQRRASEPRDAGAASPPPPSPPRRATTRRSRPGSPPASPKRTSCRAPSPRPSRR